MAEKTAKNGRGGAREGAGRPPAEEASVVVSGRLLESEAKLLESLAAQKGCARSAFVSEVLRDRLRAAKRAKK